MQSTRIPAAQQRGLMKLHPAVGMGILAAGLGLLVFAMARGMTRPAAAPPGTEEALAKAEADAHRLDSQVKSTSEEATKGEATLKGKQDEFAQRSKRLEAREEEIKRLEQERDRRVADSRKKVEEDQSQIRKEVATANQALMQKDNERQEQANVQRFLADYEKMLVTVVNTDLGLNTGFFLEVQRKMYVATHKIAAPANTDVVLRLKIRIPGDPTPYTAALRGVVSYKDKETGLTFLSLDTSNLNLRFTITGFKTSALAESAVGEKVYSLGSQVLGAEFLEFSAMDGNVSAEEREVGRGRYMQVSMPANPGSTGSPIFNVKGQIVGILVGPAPDLEKTAFAISSRQVLEAINRWQNGGVAAANPNAGPQGPAQPTNSPPLPKPAPLPQRTPQFSAGDSLRAAQNRPIPYKDMDSLKGPFAANVRDVFQADGGLVIADYSAAKVYNYAPLTHRKLWELDIKNPGFRVIREGGGTRGAVINVRQDPPSMEFDLSSGKVAGTYANANKFTDLGSYYNLGKQWLINHSTSFELVDPSTGNLVGGQFPEECVVAVQQGQALVLTSKKGVGLVDLNRVMPLQLEMQDLWSQRYDKATPQNQIQNLDTQIESIKQKMSGLFLMLDLTRVIPENEQYRREAYKSVPGGFKLFVYSHLIEVRANGLKYLGSLENIEHSAAKEAWYEHYWFRLSSCTGAWVLDVSADGRYAVTSSHVYDVATLKAVAEVPIPSNLVGFTGDGKVLYVYDPLHAKLAFFPLDALIQSGVKR